MERIWEEQEKKQAFARENGKVRLIETMTVLIGNISDLLAK